MIEEQRRFRVGLILAVALIGISLIPGAAAGSSGAQAGISKAGWKTCGWLHFTGRFYVQPRVRNLGCREGRKLGRGFVQIARRRDSCLPHCQIRTFTCGLTNQRTPQWFCRRDRALVLFRAKEFKKR